MITIGKVKYTIAQVGHLLHYDHICIIDTNYISKICIANPVSDLANKKSEESRRKSIFVNSIAIPRPSIRPTIPIQLIPSSSNYTNTLSSFDFGSDDKLKADKVDTACMDQKLPDSKLLRNFFYTNYNLLEEFDGDIKQSRMEHLKRYSKWKTEKWIMREKRYCYILIP